MDKQRSVPADARILFSVMALLVIAVLVGAVLVFNGTIK